MNRKLLLLAGALCAALVVVGSVGSAVWQQRAREAAVGLASAPVSPTESSSPAPSTAKPLVGGEKRKKRVEPARRGDRKQRADRGRPQAAAAETQRLVARVEAQARRLPVPAAAPVPTAAPDPGVPTTFVLASFNVLGSQHTAGGPLGQRFAAGRVRAGWAAELIEARGADIVGLQEVQADQLDVLASATGGRFDFWPGRDLGGPGIPQSVMWRTDRWEKVWGGAVSVPFMDQVRPQPIVQLRHRATGAEIFVLNAHNSPGGMQRSRDVALGREIEVVNSLRRESGLPVFLIGDLNEREGAFCRVTGSTDLVSPAGGSNDGVCRPAGDLRVDWIFGPPEASYAGYVKDRSPLVQRITDHSVLFTAVTLP